MKRKQGISLIVLVITIIVMIILAASVVITLSNTGVIDRANQAVNLTNEAQVQDLASLTWMDAYMDNLRGEDLVEEVTTKLSEQGVTAEDWNITVTDTGVSVTSKINSAKKIIKFTVAGIEYQAEEGMTWLEWANSEYNEGGNYEGGGNGFGVSETTVNNGGAGVPVAGVVGTDVIIANYAYEYDLSNIS